MANAVGVATSGAVVARKRVAPRTAVCIASPVASLRLRCAAVPSASRAVSSVKATAAPALRNSFVASSSLNGAVAASIARKSHASRTVVKCDASAAADE